MDEGRWNEILAGITASRLEPLIRRIAASQAEANRDGVGIIAVINAATGGADLGTGAVGWERFVRVREAVRQAVDQIDGMRYVEADD